MTIQQWVKNPYYGDENDQKLDDPYPGRCPCDQPDRLFGGQRFVFHKAAEAPWQPGMVEGIEYQDTGIGEATSGIASLLVLRASQGVEVISLDHDGDLRFLFVLEGTANFDGSGAGQWQLQQGDSCAIPSSSDCRLTDVSADFRTLELSVPSQ